MIQDQNQPQVERPSQVNNQMVSLSMATSTTATLIDELKERLASVLLCQPTQEPKPNEEVELVPLACWMLELELQVLASNRSLRDIIDRMEL